MTIQIHIPIQNMVKEKMKYLNIENAAINWKKEKVICSFISKRGISTSILLRDILSLMAVGLVY